MAIIQRIMGAMGIKSASKTVKTAKSLATAIAQPSVTSKAIDKKMSADAAQGMAMVNMSGKKAYIAPQIKTYQLPKKSKLTAASGEGGSGHIRHSRSASYEETPMFEDMNSDTPDSDF